MWYHHLLCERWCYPKHVQLSGLVPDYEGSTGNLFIIGMIGTADPYHSAENGPFEQNRMRGDIPSVGPPISCF